MTPRSCSSVVTHMVTSSSSRWASVVPALALPAEGGGLEPGERARRSTSRPAFESVEGGTFQVMAWGTVGSVEEGVVVGGSGFGRGLKVGRRVRGCFFVGGGGGGGGGGKEVCGEECCLGGEEENLAAMGQEGRRVVRQVEPGVGEA